MVEWGIERPSFAKDEDEITVEDRAKDDKWSRPPALQGYLAHRKTPTPRGPLEDPRYRPTVGS